eukprot:CAMPEP_0194033216 /NCGR_PEP_ID=MMETSP0009_2-20130614/5983_1 /TAXON_ID=210454 /ORGANISM="Grammatophora oceanica, Strain CCMP 410" /LENGTH=237 /DNA_ID=CAMNT_0038673863 /DNA_START=68 /DNA_END=781 /DNA_ORIENTATION=+
MYSHTTQDFVATNTSPLDGAFEPTRIEEHSALKNVGRRRPRRVSFEAVEVVGVCEASSAMTDKERSELWYQQQDLSQFKSDIRETCKTLKSNTNESALLDMQLVRSGRDSSCTRGLEHRVSMERQKNKYLCLKAVLKAQTRYTKPEQVALVASRCSAWAKEVALATGHQDFYMAYNPSMIHMVPQSPTVPFPLSTKKRVSLEVESDSEDSVERLTKRRRLQRTNITSAPPPAVIELC